MKWIPYISFLLIGLNLTAQNANKIVRQGNKAYDNNQYIEAEVKYKTALEKDPERTESVFNLGNALYKQEIFNESSKQYESYANLAEDDKTKSKSYYNLGNSYFKSYQAEKKPQEKMRYLNESIKAYKNALKLNPYDSKAKYNLTYAQKHKDRFQKQQQKQEQQKKNQQNKKDNKKDQNQDQDKKKGQQNKQNQQENSQKKEQEHGQQAQPQQMTPKEAERLLKAIQDDEKEVMKKLLLKKQKSKSTKTEKEW